jgi:CRP/FNR family transcriptional regulator, cyclic AMP receptor protein
MSRKQELKAIRLFAEFDGDDVDAFVAAGRRKTWPADHLVFEMGSLNSSLFVIYTGSVKVDRVGTAGDIPLATLGAGETFGEMSFMDGSRTTAAVTTTVPTEVLEISRESVDRLLGEKPDLGMKFWRNLALDLKQRLTKTDEVIDQYVDLNQVLLQDQSLREYYSRL